MKTKIYENNLMTYFPLYPSTIAFNREQETVIRENGYPMNQIFLVEKGSGVLNIDNKTFSLNSKDFFYIASDVKHEYYGTTSSFQLTFLSFKGNSFENIKKYYSLGNYGVYKNKNKGLFEASVKNLYEIFDATRELSSICALTFSTVITFFDEVHKKERSEIEKVYDYLEENYAENITLDDILNIYPYSKAKLCRDFKQKYNLTIFDCLMNIRLRHANYMLTDNPYIKLKTIANSCGFNDVSYFCKMYKRKFNSSPKSN